ncbi:MAG: phage holin family protein [Flammeovirgaceae bacterium]|nr:phage holin family protein [Flammeovirgaceae bacterium]
MNGLIRFLLSGLAVMLTSYLLQNGVHVEHYGYALLVAVVISIANVIVKPILVLFTIPITVVTLGLFLLVINAVIILLVDYLVPGFQVDGFWWALGFSLILSIFNSMIADMTKRRIDRHAFNNKNFNLKYLRLYTSVYRDVTDWTKNYLFKKIVCVG